MIDKNKLFKGKFLSNTQKSSLSGLWISTFGSVIKHISLGAQNFYSDCRTEKVTSKLNLKVCPEGLVLYI